METGTLGGADDTEVKEEQGDGITVARSMQNAKVLIIDDQATNAALLERVVENMGLRMFQSTTDSRAAVDSYLEFCPDIILLDVHMPHLNGLQVLAQLRELIGTEYLPIVILTADVTAGMKRQALRAGATDFLLKPVDVVEVQLRIRNLLEARFTHLQLEATVRERTEELTKAMQSLEEAQDKVIQRERLAAFGTMAGGVAHDFNNALSVIMGFSEHLLREADHGLTNDAARTALTTILTAADDAAKVVHRLREFYRPDESSDLSIAVELNSLVQQAIDLTSPRWKIEASGVGNTIKVETKLEEVPPVSGNASELREMLTNLIFNAVDAMPHGGSIVIRTRREENWVTLVVSDTGSGMSEEVRRRCLEPFFTTKGQLGTGLGLAMVYGIVERHGGTLDIESTPGEGTSFLCRLPISTASSTPDVKPAASCELLRLLLVEDQPLLLEILTEILKHDGHTVECAEGGEEALQKFSPDAFDVVITDQSMPGMTGSELARAIKLLSPTTPILMLTGYANLTDKSEWESQNVDHVLGKPVGLIELRQALVQVMGSTPP